MVPLFIFNEDLEIPKNDPKYKVKKGRNFVLFVFR
jgi:hypothetical protein